jgi:hypothetical protein
MITETLYSILNVVERKRLDSYDSEKTALLYKLILEDTGIANIQRLITQLNDKAKKELEDGDRKRKRKIAISEASRSVDNRSAAGIRDNNGRNIASAGISVGGGDVVSGA